MEEKSPIFEYLPEFLHETVDLITGKKSPFFFANCNLTEFQAFFSIPFVSSTSSQMPFSFLFIYSPTHLKVFFLLQLLRKMHSINRRRKKCSIINVSHNKHIALLTFVVDVGPRVVKKEGRPKTMIRQPKTV